MHKQMMIQMMIATVVIGFFAGGYALSV